MCIERLKKHIKIKGKKIQHFDMFYQWKSKRLSDPKKKSDFYGCNVHGVD